MSSPDGGYLDMDTGAVVEQMAALTGVADGVGVAWAGTGAEVDGHRPGIGDDFLGHLFHRVYDPDETRARESADRVAPALRGSAQVGEQCAYLYRAADANGRNGMPAPASPRGPR
jgi:hypothetical protein